MALANATDGAARATVLRITQTEPSHGFVAWQALVDGYAPKSSNDPAVALKPILATRKDAKELKERLTAWSLKVAECPVQNDGRGTEDIRGEGDDAEGHQTGIPDGSEKI